MFSWADANIDLGILTQREHQIRSFVPQDYFEGKHSFVPSSSVHRRCHFRRCGSTGSIVDWLIGRWRSSL